MSKTPMIGTDSLAPSFRRSTSVRSCITTPSSLICRCTMKSIPSSLAKNSAMNARMASRPSIGGVGGILRYTASSLKQLAISSGSGLDHSAQNLVTTSLGECIMLMRNAPAPLVNPHPHYPARVTRNGVHRQKRVAPMMNGHRAYERVRTWAPTLLIDRQLAQLRDVSHRPDPVLG